MALGRRLGALAGVLVVGGCIAALADYVPPNERGLAGTGAEQLSGSLVGAGSSAQ